MVKRDLSASVADARWAEAAGTAAYLLEQPPDVVQRAAAATLILISAQLGDLLAVVRQQAGLEPSEAPFLLERGELFIDQPHVYERRSKSATPTEGFPIHRPTEAA